MSTTNTDELVTSLVLVERGYEDVPRRVEKAMREVDTAHARGIDSTKRLSKEINGPDAYSGFSRLAKEAKAYHDAVTRAGHGGGGWNGIKKNASSLADDVRDGLSKGLSDLNPLKTLGIGLGAMAAAGAATGFKLMEQSAEFDALRKSLDAVEGSAQKSKRAMADLKGLAKAPGLGFEEAVSAYSGLRNAELSEDFAKRAIAGFAKGNARGGGGSESFGRIMLQVRQAAGREFLSQEDLTPISEAGIPVNAILKKRYGTGDTEELKSKGIKARDALAAIVAELEKLPPVADSYRNQIDNLADALKFAEVSAGDALNNAFLPLGNEFAKAVTDLSEGGAITSAFETAASNIRATFDGQEDGLKGVLDQMLIAVEDLSAGARNLAENAKGAKDGLDGFGAKVDDFFTWVDQHDPTSEGFGKSPEEIKRLYGYEGDPNEFDTSLSGEHARSERAHQIQSQLQKERDAMHRAGFQGGLQAWNKMPRSQQEAAIKDAEDKAKMGAGKSDPGKSGEPASGKTDPVAERTMRATEALVSMKKREMDMATMAAGGGELARMGVTATELSGGGTSRNERMARQIAKIIAENIGLASVDHGVRQARYSGGRG